MVKELVLPVAVRKLRIRLIEEVDEADFQVAAHAEELIGPTTINRHAVANSLVGHGYGERFLDVEAPFKDTFQNLIGDSYIDNESIVSYGPTNLSAYRQLDAGKFAGELNLPAEVRDMQLVIKTDSLSISSQEETGVPTIDMIAIRKKVQPALEPAQVTTGSEIVVGNWQRIEPSKR